MNYLRGALFYLWKLYIGLIFVLTLLFFYPALYIVLQREDTKHYSFTINRAWSRTVRFFCFYAIEINGVEEFIEEPVIIVANHTSYLDIFLLYSTLPRNKFIFMGKSELLDYPLVKTFFKHLNIPVDRSSSMQSAKAFIRAKNEMEKGWSIVIFPEGGILDPTKKIYPFKDGAFQLAKSAKAAILPITFQNNYRLFSDPSNFTYPAMPGLVRVHIHPLITTQEVEKYNTQEIKSIAYRKISSVLT